jgi:hypothetical protein
VALDLDVARVDGEAARLIVTDNRATAALADDRTIAA